MEEWKQCGTGKRCDYYVSNMGRIKSITKRNKKEKFVKLILSNGYQIFNMAQKTYRVHCLVALYFIGERPSGLVIDHINRVRNDNRVENLRYCTILENYINSDRYRTDIDEKDKDKRNKIIKLESQKRIRNNKKH